VCPDQAAALVEQADFDLVVIDCDSLAGRELATVAQESQENHIFRLLCLCSGEAGIQATIVQKPINIQSLTNALHGVLPLFP
jgi:hypothetical protein